MTIYQVPVTKGKGTVEIDSDALPEAVYKEVFLQGLKVVTNRGTTKITKETYPDAEQLKAAAMAKAQEQVAAMLAGKIRIMGAKTDKVSGAVMTEARRLARNLVKDAMKREGIKVSHVEASEITKAANALLAAQPELIEQAKTSLEERGKVKVGIDVKAIPVSDKKVKAAAAKKAKDKATLSATQAGRVAKHKPGQQAHTQH